MNTEKLKALKIAPEEKSRPQGAVWSIVIVVLIVLLAAVAFIKPWAKDKRELADNTAGNTISTNAAIAKSVSEPHMGDPVAQGVLRAVERPVLHEMMDAQIGQAKADFPPD